MLTNQMMKQRKIAAHNKAYLKSRTSSLYNDSNIYTEIYVPFTTNRRRLAFFTYFTQKQVNR